MSLLPIHPMAPRPAAMENDITLTEAQYREWYHKGQRGIKIRRDLKVQLGGRSVFADRTLHIYAPDGVRLYSHTPHILQRSR